MRWTRRCAKTKRACSRTAKPCGPDAPTLAFKSVDDASHHDDDGGKKARSPGRARSKPLKPLRREGRMTPPLPVATTLVCFFICTRGCGCGEHPVFPAPSRFQEGEGLAKLGRYPRRGKEKLCPTSDVIACDKREAFAQGSGSDEAIQSCFRGTILDCFALLAMTARKSPASLCRDRFGRQ